MKLLRIAALGLVAPLFAQEGHPIVGSWHGNWGVNAKDRNDVTLILNYDGKNIIGMINPGVDVAKIQKASLEPAGWMVHIEADRKDKSGKLVHVVIDGKIEDVTYVRRAIVGTWMEGSAKGDFKVTRDE
jgi:hypothetical protein